MSNEQVTRSNKSQSDQSIADKRRQAQRQRDAVLAQRMDDTPQDDTPQDDE